MVNLKILIVPCATKWLIFQNSVTYVTEFWKITILSCMKQLVEHGAAMNRE